MPVRYEMRSGKYIWIYVMGLIRKAIFIGGALMAMPSPPAQVQTGAVALSYPSSSWTYIAAAADTVADFKSFCERKPQVCTTAQYLAGTLEGKAKYSAKLVYEWASETTATQPEILAKVADPIKTGTVDSQMAASLSANSTLRIEDLIPEWRGTIKG
jgi:Family of unknown function (DUF5330)